ncbi:MULTISPECIES: ABC transporter ATP-binding protein [unclassified Streptomyces]|uniref:ABC transporter ATP-binding protein n=1 Tax=unclassified Streptomyces TaxID=2593676 RepID=UPI000BF2E6B2|nr:ABC transporter ATP-binding protein [Streptomyces sp. Ru87]PGH52010.1 antibiotic ABC transporter ATP-binding protein [Streptomyces sp. Ru87]
MTTALAPRGRRKGPRRRPANRPKTGRHLARLLLAEPRHRGALARLAAWSALGAVPVLLSGQLVAVALDRGFLAGDGLFGLAVLGGYGATLLLGALATRQAFVPMAGLVESVRDQLLRGTVHGSLHAAVASGRTPDTGAVSRITSQSERVRQLLSALLLSLSTTAFAAGAAVAGLLGLAPVLALITLPVVASTAALLVPLSRRWRTRYEASLTMEELVAEETGRTLDGMRDIVACAATRRAEDDLDGVLSDHAASGAAVATVSGMRVGVIALAARVPLLALLLSAPALLAGGTLSTGELLGAATYLVSGLEPALRALVQSIGNLGLELGTLVSRLAAHGGTPAPATAAAAGATAPGHDVLLAGVTFRYGPHSQPVLSAADLAIPDGDHVTLVGPSGVGKSTLADVLAGLTLPEAGEVRLGGVDLRTLDRAWLRRTVALVPQEAYVFAGTLRENLAYLAPDADTARLDRAVDALGIGAFVRGLGGYDAHVAGPGALSQGQRQLITLARVYLSPARIVILDEATCHVDPETEARVENAFARRDGTLVVIAHRISSALRARRVVILQDGRLEAARHEDLLRRSPAYADLVGHWHGAG